MAFKNEDIPDDLRKKFNIESKHLDWTADHENNCFLICKKIDRENTHHFDLYYNDNLVEVRAIEDYKGNRNTYVYIDYIIEFIYMYQVPMEKKMDVEQKLIEALQEFCSTGRKIINSTVTVDFTNTNWKKN